MLAAPHEANLNVVLEAGSVMSSTVSKWGPYLNPEIHKVGVRECSCLSLLGETLAEL